MCARGPKKSKVRPARGALARSTEGRGCAPPRSRRGAGPGRVPPPTPHATQPTPATYPPPPAPATFQTRQDQFIAGDGGYDTGAQGDQYNYGTAPGVAKV